MLINFDAVSVHKRDARWQPFGELPTDDVHVLSVALQCTSAVGANMSDLESDSDAAFAALSRSAPTTVIVTGSRAGIAGEQERSLEFAERVHARFPNLPIHVGGRTAGPLCECVDRIGFGRDAAGQMLARNVEWLALQAMADLASGER